MHAVQPPFYTLHARYLVEFCHALQTGALNSELFSYYYEGRSFFCATIDRSIDDTTMDVKTGTPIKRINTETGLYKVKARLKVFGK